jgi:hypothetical protein
VPVLSDDVCQRDNQADRAAAAEARQRAAWHRAEADRIAAGRSQLVEAATVEYFAARGDARIIAAGPGRFGRRTAQIEAAQTRRDELSRRWNDQQPPGSQWPDDTVRRQATAVADQIINTQISPHISEANQAEQTATRLDRQLTSRDRHQHNATVTNQHRTGQRQTLTAAPPKRTRLGNAKSPVKQNRPFRPVNTSRRQPSTEAAPTSDAEEQQGAFTAREVGDPGKSVTGVNDHWVRRRSGIGWAVQSPWLRRQVPLVLHGTLAGVWSQDACMRVVPGGTEPTT